MTRRKGARRPPRHAAGTAVMDREDQPTPETDTNRTVPDLPGAATVTTTEPELTFTPDALDDEYETAERARKRARAAGMEASGLQAQAERRTSIAEDLRRQAAALNEQADTELRAAESEARQAESLRGIEKAERAIAEHRAAQLDEYVQRSGCEHPRVRRERAAKAAAAAHPIPPLPNGDTTGIPVDPAPADVRVASGAEIHTGFPPGTSPNGEQQ